jgi:hypothetical protein
MFSKQLAVESEQWALDGGWVVETVRCGNKALTAFVHALNVEIESM